MKPIKINEGEKNRILGLHNSKIIVEQATTGKTIADLQTLLGVKADGYLGPQTLAAIKAKLGQLGTTPQGTNVDGITYDILKKVGWTDEQIAKDPKYKSLLPKGAEQQTQGTQTLAQDTSMTAGKTEITLGGQTTTTTTTKKPDAMPTIDSTEI